MRILLAILIFFSASFSSILAPAQASEKKISVPMINARENTVNGANVFSTLQADKSIVVAYFGQDENLFNEAKEAVREALAAGESVRWMVFGPATEESYVQIFANNQLVSKKGLKTKEDIKLSISKAHTEIVQPSLR